MKKPIHLFSACLLAAIISAPVVIGAPLLLPPASVLYTSFEENDTPPYFAGRLDGQNGWLLKGSTVQSSAQVVIGGSGGNPPSPDGLQMVALRNAKNNQGVFAGPPKVSLQFATTPYTDSLYFSGLTGFSGTLTEATGVISRFYLNGTNEFNGVIFGLQKSGDDVRFFYNNGNAAVSFGDSVASADTFYRFEVDVDIAGKKFDIRVYDYATNTLLGSSQDAAFRGDTASLSYLRLNNLSNPPTNGDDFATYYDQVWISTNPIPEPAAVSLLFGSGFLMMLFLRHRSLYPIRNS